MPTGYTATLMEKGQTFEEFVLLCARAFGATITMRDDPMDEPIPDEFKPGDYYAGSISERSAELARLEGMTNGERVRFGETEKSNALARYSEYLEKERGENERLENMQLKVTAWIPPSPDHVEMKSFMLQQIEISKNTGNYYYKAFNDADNKTPYMFYAEAVESARSGLGYSREEYAKELERVAGRNRWVRQLRESLKK